MLILLVEFSVLAEPHHVSPKWHESLPVRQIESVFRVNNSAVTPDAQADSIVEVVGKLGIDGFWAAVMHLQSTEPWLYLAELAGSAVADQTESAPLSQRVRTKTHLSFVSMLTSLGVTMLLIIDMQIAIPTQSQKWM